MNSSNHCNNLEFDQNLKSSHIFENIPKNGIDYVRDQKGAYFNHVHGVEYEKYELMKTLKSFSIFHPIAEM